MEIRYLESTLRIFTIQEMVISLEIIKILNHIFQEKFQMNITIHTQNQKDLLKNIKLLLINGLQKKMKNSHSGSLIDSDLRYLENM